jgi:GTP 3',8-cyclase
MDGTERENGGGMRDGYARVIDYLRVSVTDRCNLRCIYCMPPGGVPLQSHGDLLTFEEIVSVVAAAVELGVRKVRLTGGEPLVRLGLTELVRQLACIDGLNDLSLSTNGTLLKEHAAALKAAGLRRVNVSLDSLKPERYRRITRQGELADALGGIEAAQEAGLTPIKINAVVMRGCNDDEVADLAALAGERGWSIRFIERMPLAGSEGGYVSAAEVRAKLDDLGPLLPGSDEVQNGPARCYRLAGTAGSVGFISPLSEPFCATCNRLRLTSTGMLRPCLLSNEGEVDLRATLRAGASREAIQRLLLRAAGSKPGRHSLRPRDGSAQDTTMSQIGG